MKNYIFAALVVVISTGCQGDDDDTVVDDEASYTWVPGELIPNEFGLENGTWSDHTISECIDKCSADENCTGFSVVKELGDAWNGGCEGDACAQTTECHAKGTYGSSALWTASDAEILVPEFDADSNDWVNDWGTVLKD